MEKLKAYVSITLKYQKKNCVNVGPTPFHLDLWGKKFYVYVAKMFLFLSVAHVFRIAQKLQNLNLQCR